MQFARLSLLLLAFGLAHKAYATNGPKRREATRAAFEKLAAKKAAQCIQKGQGSSKVCSRPAIQIAIANENKKREAFKAQVDPIARTLAGYRAKEAAAARAAGHASVGSSVVVRRSRL